MILWSWSDMNVDLDKKKTKEKKTTWYITKMCGLTKINKTLKSRWYGKLLFLNWLSSFMIWNTLTQPAMFIFFLFHFELSGSFFICHKVKNIHVKFIKWFAVSYQLLWTVMFILLCLVWYLICEGNNHSKKPRGN